MAIAGAVRLRRRVVGRERRTDGCISLDDRPVGHQGVRDGLVHLRRGAVADQLVGVGLRQEGHEVRRGLRPREVIGERPLYGVAGLLGRAVAAERGEHPGLAGLREASVWAVLYASQVSCSVQLSLTRPRPMGRRRESS